MHRQPLFLHDRNGWIFAFSRHSLVTIRISTPKNLGLNLLFLTLWCKMLHENTPSIKDDQKSDDAQLLKGWSWIRFVRRPIFKTCPVRKHNSFRYVAFPNGKSQRLFDVSVSIFQCPCGSVWCWLDQMKCPIHTCHEPSGESHPISTSKKGISHVTGMPRKTHPQVLQHFLLACEDLVAEVV